MSLTPIESFRGAKNKHPTTRCVCDCGNERIVRTTKLRLELVTMCGACAKREAGKRGAETRRQLSADEKQVSDRYSIYKQNAKRRNMKFNISLVEFSALIKEQCAYCGTSERVGVDRVDSAFGYFSENCAPCCSDCNYAKRELSKDSFLSLIGRIHAYQGK